MISVHTQIPPRHAGAVARRRRATAWRVSLLGTLLASLLATLLPLATAVAAGPIWLPTKQATFMKVTNESLSMATYRNHAYMLWLEEDASHPNYWVYYTTNATGAWTTRVLSKDGPGAGGVGDVGRARIAVDPTLHRLYAVWSAAPPAGAANQQGSLILYTSNDEGATWQGPTTLAHSATASIFPNIALAAGGGKAAVTFDAGAGDFGKGVCKNIGTNDIFIVSYNGASWSPPQNVSSCVDSNTTNNGWRAQQLAYDESTGRFSLVAIDASNAYHLWFMQGSGATWSAPAPTPMTNVTTGSGNSELDFQAAAAAGTTYVAYPAISTPGKAWCCVDVYLATHPSGQGWMLQRITQDPLNCQKFDLALAARPGRLALAYRWGGFCAKPKPPSGPPEDYIHVLTGLPGHFQEFVPFKPPVPSNCLRPVISTDGDLFRVVQVCSNNGATGTNLYYTPEFLDVVGPTTHIKSLAPAGPGAMRVAWSAQDPTPGSGVAYATVQVRVDGGAWQSVVAATQSHFIMYTHAQSGHTYTFRVRSRDKVNNWGAWVTATLKAA